MLPMPVLKGNRTGQWRDRASDTGRAEFCFQESEAEDEDSIGYYRQLEFRP